MEKPKRVPKRIFDTIIVRNYENMQIVIYDPKTVYIKVKGQYITYCFQRWFHKKQGFYSNNWKPFIIWLQRSKYLTLDEIRNRALDLDIVVQGGCMPNWQAKKHKIIE